jgi:Domain of unknown function (DUF4124)
MSKAICLVRVSVALAVVIAGPAQSAVYKCVAANGIAIYQESPCATAGVKLAAPDPSPPSKNDSAKAKSADAKAMKEAFQARMDRGDYQGALAFATDDMQKSLARKKLHDRNVKCEKLAGKITSARNKDAADAAKSEYRLICR